MKISPSRNIAGTLILAAGLFAGARVSALSMPIGRDVNFPKDYDPAKAKAIRAVIQDEHFKFVGGLVSYWEPDFGTRLSFEGDAGSLNEFMRALRRLPEIGLRVILYKGRNDELRRDSPFQFDFSQAHPNQVGVYINLNSPAIDFDKVELPDWPGTPDKKKLNRESE
jgi:hypothetical protein